MKELSSWLRNTAATSWLIMSSFSFPFWIVTRRHGLVPLPVELEEPLGFVAVFTTAENAATFMTAQGETEWQNKLVTRATLPPLLAHLRHLNVQGVYVDPVPGGNHTTFTLDDLEHQ